LINITQELYFYYIFLLIRYDFSCCAITSLYKIQLYLSLLVSYLQKLKALLELFFS